MIPMIQSKYFMLYNRIIDNRIKNPLEPGEYGETHHIVPRSCDGPDEDPNLVRLSAREHYLVHYLLTKFTSGTQRGKMIKAFDAMGMCGRGQQERKFILNSRLFQKNRIRCSEIQVIPIDIYDEKGNFQMSNESVKFYDFCRSKNLPFGPLVRSYNNDGRVIGQIMGPANKKSMSELTLKYAGWSALRRKDRIIPRIVPKMPENRHHSWTIVDIYDNTGIYRDSIEGIISKNLGPYPKVLLRSIKNHGEPILTNNIMLGQVDKKYHKYAGWFGIKRKDPEKIISYVQPKKANIQDIKSYRSSDVEIYDDGDDLIYTSTRSFRRFCKDHDLPYKALFKTIKTKVGCYTVQKCRTDKYKKYKGWYAIKLDD